jgi:hypothetical protein
LSEVVLIFLGTEDLGFVLEVLREGEGEDLGVKYPLGVLYFSASISSKTFCGESSGNPRLSDMASACCASLLPGAGDMLSRAAVFESTGCATMISS